MHYYVGVPALIILIPLYAYFTLVGWWFRRREQSLSRKGTVLRLFGGVFTGWGIVWGFRLWHKSRQMRILCSLFIAAYLAFTLPAYIHMVTDHLLHTDMPQAASCEIVITSAEIPFEPIPIQRQAVLENGDFYAALRYAHEMDVSRKRREQLGYCQNALVRSETHLQFPEMYPTLAVACSRLALLRE